MCSSDLTTVTTVRPVTADGQPAAGWTVKKLSGSVTCDGSSLAAVDDGIASCYPTAYSLRACYPSSNHTTLCVRDVADHRLFRVRYTGAFPSDVTAPADPSPLKLVLDDGEKCLLRVGGAWGSPPAHPNWLGHYSCTDGSVYAPASSETGVDVSEPVWTVKVWNSEADTITKHAVERAVFAGAQS